MTPITQEQLVDLARRDHEHDVSGHLMNLPADGFAKKLAEAIEAATKTCPPVGAPGRQTR